MSVLRTTVAKLIGGLASAGLWYHGWMPGYGAIKLNKGWSKADRWQLQEATPGPGAYEPYPPEKKFVGGFMGAKANTRKPQPTPGPGAYNVRACMGQAPADSLRKSQPKAKANLKLATKSIEVVEPTLPDGSGKSFEKKDDADEVTTEAGSEVGEDVSTSSEEVSESEESEKESEAAATVQLDGDDVLCKGCVALNGGKRAGLEPMDSKITVAEIYEGGARPPALQMLESLSGGYMLGTFDPERAVDFLKGKKEEQSALREFLEYECGITISGDDDFSVFVQKFKDAMVARGGVLMQCDHCLKSIPESYEKKIYHCTKGHCDAHPAGYDVCQECVDKAREGAEVITEVD